MVSATFLEGLALKLCGDKWDRHFFRANELGPSIPWWTSP